MKYKPLEPSTDLLRELCCNIGEDMKYVLSEICHHNSYFPKNKITIEYKNGSNECEISDKNKFGECTFIKTCKPGDDYKYFLGLIRGYSYGLNAAGIRTTTPKEL